MKYLIWRRQVALLAKEQGITNWDSMTTWRDLFLQNFTPEQALIKAKLDNFD
ncbi:hypothetical protein AN214_04030 [Pseudoalteromonas sp. P1-9]|uniref:hypothetical protein n=1 Tax=Pseudoalteromonas sp. P1-9 TaxID=1710354 RepID=UPI0007080519|nr:hypothetical protein [Pseudoalteromonas sp. P1-9]KPV93931.1 hypothetical protein AN214_04030 [Pseudoalteromonas sp. P1-9]